MVVVPRGDAHVDFYELIEYFGFELGREGNLVIRVYSLKSLIYQYSISEIEFLIQIITFVFFLLHLLSISFSCLFGYQEYSRELLMPILQQNELEKKPTENSQE